MIYVVMGETGAYSDHSSWHVKAFRSRSSADDLCRELNEWCEENGVSESSSLEYGLRCPLDPQFQVDYTGTNYTVVEIPDNAD